MREYFIIFVNTETNIFNDKKLHEKKLFAFLQLNEFATLIELFHRAALIWIVKFLLK